MLDGHPLSKMGRTKAALKIALYASTFGGIFSALVLLFLGPQVAKISAQLDVYKRQGQLGEVGQSHIGALAGQRVAQTCACLLYTSSRRSTSAPTVTS